MVSKIDKSWSIYDCLTFVYLGDHFLKKKIISYVQSHMLLNQSLVLVN